MTDKSNIVWHDHLVSRDDRSRQSGHRGCVVWFTGLSGSGKSTVANLVDKRLFELSVNSYLLDGDNVRHGLCAPPARLSDRHDEEFATRFGLGFSAQDREENIRRIGEVARLFCDAGVVTLTAFVSPYRRDRDAVRAMLAPSEFVEVFVDAPLEICESRDPKGLYAKARAGEIPSFTGISDPYEPPLGAELVLDAGTRSAEDLADEVIAHLRAAGIIH